MLPKSKRFTTEDFRKLRGMRTMHTPHFFVRIRSVETGKGKAAVIVAASVYKKAAERNLLRRRMYSIIEKCYSLVDGHELTVTMKKGALDVPFPALEKVFTALFTQHLAFNARRSAQGSGRALPQGPTPGGQGAGFTERR